MKYLLLIVLISTFSSCIKNSEDKLCPREFTINGEVAPYDSVYHIGDTIKFSYEYSRYLVENNHNKEYDLLGVKYDFLLTIYDIDTTEISYKTIDYIDIVNIMDTMYYSSIDNDGNSSVFFYRTLKNDSFFVNIEMIVKKRGLFLLGFGPFLFESNQRFPDKCNGFTFNINGRLNNGYDNNIYLLSKSPNPHYNNWVLQNSKERFYNSGFAYKVE